MNPDPHRLLDEILEEAAPGEFRSAVLEQTLRRVRRRRVVRKAMRGVIALALLAGLPFVIFRTAVISHHDTLGGFPKIAMVSSQPTHPSMLVETKPGAATVVNSASGALVVVETGAMKDSPREIFDDELLALVAGRPAVLVRHSPHQAELLFLNAEDQNGFRVE